jgi:hypothetical protein
MLDSLSNNVDVYHVTEKNISLLKASLKILLHKVWFQHATATETAAVAPSPLMISVVFVVRNDPVDNVNKSSISREFDDQVLDFVDIIQASQRFPFECYIAFVIAVLSFLVPETKN